MTTSDTIKDLLNQVYGKADWKRDSKSKISDNMERRVFREPKSGITITAFSMIQSECHQLYNGNKIIFAVQEFDGELIVEFTEPFYFKAGVETPNIVEFIPFMGKVLPSYFDNFIGNTAIFPLGSVNRDQVVADLVGHGFTFDASLSDHLNKPKTSVTSTNSTYVRPANIIIPRVYQDKYYAEWFVDQPIMFGVYSNAEGIGAAFAPKSQWERDGYIFDQHVGNILDILGYKLPTYLDEDMENNFSVFEPGMQLFTPPPTITRQQVVDDLVAAGFVFSQDIDDMLNS